MAPLASQAMQVSSQSATSSPNQNQPPRAVQLLDPCWQSRPPMLRFTRSWEMVADTLKEQAEVVPPRARTVVCVVHVPESTGAVSTGASLPPD